MKIGVIGYGVVGNAVTKGLRYHGHKVYVNTLEMPDSELERNYDKATLIKECAVIFICVPTPPLPRDHPAGFGACDLSTVYQVFNEAWETWGHLSMEEEGVHTPVFAIKSTVLPGTVDTLMHGYPLVCSNPEFLRARSALDDFLHPDRIIIGTTKGEVASKMRDVYKDFDTEIIVLKPAEAELVKYLSNAFLVSKVAFAVEASVIIKSLNVDPVKVMQTVGLDARIGGSHLSPFPGRIHFNDPCLPKDLLALIRQIEKSGLDATHIKSIYRHGVKPNSELKQEKIMMEFLENAGGDVFELLRSLRDVKEDWE